MSEFKNYHPVVCLVYFAAIISFSMFVMHPVFLAISLITAIAQLFVTGGIKKTILNVSYIVPLMITASVVNPLFNHEGTTIIAYFPNGNPLTKESIYFGIAASCMFASVICRFSSFNIIMTSDKVMCLAGKAAPSMSLVISMIIRFVPMFSAKLKQIKNAQLCINGDTSKMNIIQKFKQYIKILSVMITICLENSIETADSMKCRGFGCSKRTAFSNFKFKKRDGICLSVIIFLSIYIFVTGEFLGGFYFRYFPSIKSYTVGLYSLSTQTAYLLLSAIPVIIEIYEVYRWKQLKSKI